jgi:hypothetical protein
MGSRAGLARWVGHEPHQRGEQAGQYLYGTGVSVFAGIGFNRWQLAVGLPIQLKQLWPHVKRTRRPPRHGEGRRCSDDPYDTASEPARGHRYLQLMLWWLATTVSSFQPRVCTPIRKMPDALSPSDIQLEVTLQGVSLDDLYFDSISKNQ